ncbi:hypothetical protein Dda_8339 [Drechslerella dactyloides]|uniref:Uncharacterized protein n=1 Tax=Drechslerella dactyloides TaxID=74499 RepID=A0AAD6NFR8_DREDA|nr:hypothetical protein Dda_8339 [Drechslerella dactyloides]
MENVTHLSKAKIEIATIGLKGHVDDEHYSVLGRMCGEGLQVVGMTGDDNGVCRRDAICLFGHSMVTVSECADALTRPGHGTCPTPGRIDINIVIGFFK